MFWKAQHQTDQRARLTGQVSTAVVGGKTYTTGAVGGWLELSEGTTDRSLVPRHRSLVEVQVMMWRSLIRWRIYLLLKTRYPKGTFPPPSKLSNVVRMISQEMQHVLLVTLSLFLFQKILDSPEDIGVRKYNSSLCQARHMVIFWDRENSSHDNI